MVILKLGSRPLPPDTVVRVTYGGSGKEEYRLSEPNAVHEVVFCRPANAQGEPLATEREAGVGAAGDDGSAPPMSDAPDEVESLYCELWTGGFTELAANASGLMTMQYELRPQSRECTVRKTIVLDSPDGG